MLAHGRLVEAGRVAGCVFLAFVSVAAALGFLVYGGRLFLMLQRFPIESRGRTKKLREARCCPTSARTAPAAHDRCMSCAQCGTWVPDLLFSPSKREATDTKGLAVVAPSLCLHVVAVLTHSSSRCLVEGNWRAQGA